MDLVIEIHKNEEFFYFIKLQIYSIKSKVED